jgi:hypothetical protein
MNKFFLFLAFASFALLACSDDKPQPSHHELCAKKPITKECLIGRWYLERIEGSQGCDSKGGSLKLKADGNFSFENGSVSVKENTYDEIEAYGIWKLTETGMEITCTAGNCTKENELFSVAIGIENLNLKVTNSDYPSFLGICMGSGMRFTEVFSWQGSN